jgi:hypothetical protein
MYFWNIRVGTDVHLTWEYKVGTSVHLNTTIS